MNSKAETLKAAALENGDHSQLYTKNIDGQMYLVLASELESTNSEDSQSSTESDAEPVDPDAKITVALLDENGQEVEELSFKNNVPPSRISIPDLLKNLPTTSEFISKHTNRISSLPLSTTTTTTTAETLTDSIKYLPVTSSGPNILSSTPHNTLIIKTSMPLSSLNLKSLIYSAGLAPKTQSEDTKKIPETTVSKTIAPIHLSSYHNTQAFTSSTPTISLLSQKPLTATTNFITAPISSVNKINLSLSEKSLLQCHSPSVNTSNSVIPFSTDNKLTQALTLPVATSANNQLVQSFPSSANVIKPINPANDTHQLIPKVQIANNNLVGAFMALQSLASNVQCKSLPRGQVDEVTRLSMSNNSNSLQMAPCLLISTSKADTSSTQLMTKKPTVHTSFVSQSLVSDVDQAPSQNTIVSNVASPLLPLTRPTSTSVLAPMNHTAMVQNNLQPTTALTSSIYKSLVCVNKIDSNFPSASTVLATTSASSSSISSSYSVLTLPQPNSSTGPLLVKILPKTTPSATESILTLPSLGSISSVAQSKQSTICTTSMSNISNQVANLPETNNTKDKFKKAQVYHNLTINNSLPVTTSGNSPTYLAESKTAVPVNNPPKVNHVKTIRLMTPSDACSIFSPTTTTTNTETNFSKANSLNPDINVDLQKVTPVTMCQSSNTQQSPVIVLIKPLKSNSATVTPITISSVAPANVNLNSSMNGQVFALKANQEPNSSLKIDDTVQFLKLGSLANNETNIKVELASDGANTEVEANDSNQPDNTSVLKIPASLMNDSNSKSFRLNPISNSSHYFKLGDSSDNTTNIVKLNQTSPILNLNSPGNNSNLIKIPTTVINGRHIITLPNQAQAPSNSPVVPLSNQGSSSNSQLVTLPGKTTTAAPVLTFTSQALTGSQVVTLASQASTGNQLVKLTSQPPTGTQLVTLTSQSLTGTQLVTLAGHAPTSTELVTITSQASTGTQLVTLAGQAPTGTQLVKLASQSSTGTQLVKLASQSSTGTQLVKLASQVSTGTQLVTLASQAPTGSQLCKLTNQTPTGTQLVKLTSHTPTGTQLITLASQAPTGSQLVTLTSQAPTSTQLVKLTSQTPTGSQLVKLTSQPPTGSQLVKLTSQPPTGSQLVKLTSQPPTGTQLVKLTSQPPTSTQLAKLTSQAPTGTHVKLTSQNPTGTPLVKLTSQPPTGTPLVKLINQPPTGTSLVKLTNQPQTGTSLVKLTSQPPTSTPLVKLTSQPPTGTPLVKLTNQPPTGTPLVKLTNQPPTGAPLVTLTGQSPTSTQFVKLTGQPPTCSQLVTLTSQSSTGAQLVSLPTQAQTAPVVTLASQGPTNSQLVSLTSQAPTGPQLVSLINQTPSNQQFLTVTITNQGMSGAQVVKLPTPGFPGTHIIKLPTQVTPTINLPTQSLSSTQVVKVNSDNSAPSNIKLMPLTNSPVLQLNQPSDLVIKSESSSINEQTLTTTSTNNPDYNSTASNAGINDILHKLQKGEACAVVVSRKSGLSSTPTISTTAANSVHKLVSMQSLLKPKQTPVALPSNSFLQLPFLSPKSSQKTTEDQTKMEVVEDLPMTLKIDSIFSLKDEANKGFNYWETASSTQRDNETDNQAEPGCSSKVGSISESSSPPKYEKGVPNMKPLQIQHKVVLSSNIQNEKEKMDMKIEASTQCKPIVYARLNKPKLLAKTSPTAQKHYKLHDLSNHFSVSQRRRLVDIGQIALKSKKMISVIKKAQKARPCQIRGRLHIEEVKKKKYAFLQPRVMLSQLYIPARMKSVNVFQLPSETKKSLKCNSNCIHRVRVSYPTPLLLSPASPPVLNGKSMINQAGQHLMLVKMDGKNILTPYLANSATTPNFILKDNSNITDSMSSISAQTLLLKQGISLSSNVLTLPSATISRAPVSFGSVKSIAPLKVCITPERKESVQKNELSPNKDDTMNCLQLACGIIQDNTLKRKSSLSEDFDWRGEDKNDSDWSMALEMQYLSQRSQKKKKKINPDEEAL